MPGPAFLHGETVTLAPIEDEDVDALQETINDPRVRAGLQASDPINRTEEEAWVASLAGSDNELHLAIAVDGETVGTVGLRRIDPVAGAAEIGYLLDADHWGNGYATDAVETLCAHAFEERRLHRVTARAFATNPASRRVLEKAGFTEEGASREAAFVDGEHVDVVRYGLLAGELGE